MPQGTPRTGDRGLDRTPTWGRRYWGGAMFCLLADVEFASAPETTPACSRRLRGILAAGGTIEQDWPIERILGAGDKATGTTFSPISTRRCATDALCARSRRALARTRRIREAGTADVRRQRAARRHPPRHHRADTAWGSLTASLAALATRLRSSASPHPEEPPKAASRRMGPITLLRDAPLGERSSA